MKNPALFATHLGCLVFSEVDNQGDEHITLSSPMTVNFTLTMASDPKHNAARMGKLWPHGERMAGPVLPSLLRRQAE